MQEELASKTCEASSGGGMVVATMNFGNDEVVMVVVYSLIGMIIVIPLALEMGKRAAKKA